MVDAEIQAKPAEFTNLIRALKDHPRNPSCPAAAVQSEQEPSYYE